MPDRPSFEEALRVLGEAVTDADGHARFDPGLARGTGGGIASMVVAPIRLHDVIVGVVCLEHVGDPRPWSSEARSFAGSLADFAAPSPPPRPGRRRRPGRTMARRNLYMG